MELFPGDVLLQSSDGLTDLALGREILGATRQALASGGVEHACNMLVKMANDRGGHDNITVQMVRVAEVASKASTTVPDGASRPATHAGSQASPGLQAEAPRPAGPAPTAPMQVTSPDGTPASLAYGGPASGTPLPPTAAWSLALPPQEQTMFAAPATAQPPRRAPRPRPSTRRPRGRLPRLRPTRKPRSLVRPRPGCAADGRHPASRPRCLPDRREPRGAAAPSSLHPRRRPAGRAHPRRARLRRHPHPRPGGRSR